MQRESSKNISSHDVQKSSASKAAPFSKTGRDRVVSHSGRSQVALALLIDPADQFAGASAWFTRGTWAFPGSEQP